MENPYDTIFEIIKRKCKYVAVKKVDNLINNLEKRNFIKTTLGGCIFNVKKDNLCLKMIM